MTADDQGSARREYVRSHLEILDTTIAAGRPGYLVHSVYLEVDSDLPDDGSTGSWDPVELAPFTLEGWRVVGVVARTVGLGLTNQSIGSTFGQTWGGGLGGNVAGAYILLELEVRPDDYPKLKPVVLDYLEEEALRRFPTQMEDRA